MFKLYCEYTSTHVTFNHPTAPHGEGWDGTFEIVLFTGDHVWVSASYAHARTPDILQVGDGRSLGFDQHGGCILSVPVKYVRGFHSIEEAAQIEQAIEHDARLFRYAS